MHRALFPAIVGLAVILAVVLVIVPMPARAHDPIFGLGPHVLYKGGIEVAPAFHFDKRGDERETEAALELTYGITGDWAAGLALPYKWAVDGTREARGFADAGLFTKYRFWRHDTLGAQESAAILLKVEFDSADENKAPALGTGSTDMITGLTYGYEGRKWYRWASIRYRRNGENDAGLRRGDKILLDLVGGVRPRLSGYLEADTVWLLELNAEFGDRAEHHGLELPNTGGRELFLSPGIFWTKRNFAIKAGIQLPLASDLNGNQDASDYRARLVFEWHL